MNIKSSHAAKDTKNRKTKRAPKKITERYLHNAGLYYLQRFASSSRNFREVMMRKAKKSCRHHQDQSLEDCARMIDELVKKFEGLGLLNDDIYTESMVNSLRRSGKSTKSIVARLRTKGAREDLIRKKIQQYDDEHTQDGQNPEEQAALTFARKKKLGPYTGNKETDIQKALGAFARAGFSYDVAKEILAMPAEET